MERSGSSLCARRAARRRRKPTCCRSNSFNRVRRQTSARSVRCGVPPLGRVQFLCTSGFRSSRFGPIVPLRRADKLGAEFFESNNLSARKFPRWFHPTARDAENLSAPKASGICHGCVTRLSTNAATDAGLRSTQSGSRQMAMKSRLKFGTSSDDTLNGTEQSEIFLGFGGNDTIFARGGNHHAFGGRGNDLIFGGNGNDHLFGGRGNDALVGEAGKDHLFGGSGRDLLLGGPGKDLLVGGADNDTYLIRHGAGVDTIADLQAGDRIDIRDFNFASFQAVLNAGHQAHDDVVINLGGGDQLVIEDAKLSDLHAEQFIISSQIQGPTSSQTPYLVSANSHVTVESLITTGDQALNGYTMVGIPDGLGAFDNGNGTFTVLMNHEISNSNPALAGAVRAHGANGAFVSEWVIDTATQTYVDHNAALGNGVSFSRFCSADLADANAFYNPATGLGFNPADGRLFLDGEENNAEGRAMAHIVGGAQDGNSYELAWLGNMAYENQLANPFTGDKTVVG